MQLILLGMHRSGTSVAAGLINMMGAYFGQGSSSIGANQENPKGFWERRDVRDLNDFVLKSINCDWNRVSEFNLESIEASTLTEFEARATNIIAELDSNTPWILKEPRICLLYELWKKHLSSPITILIYRDPLEVAMSLQVRNMMPLHTGLALWEYYNSKALSALEENSTVYASHRRMMTEPIKEVAHIYRQLTRLGVSSLRIPSDSQIESFVSTELYRQKASISEHTNYLSGNQKTMFDSLQGENITDPTSFQYSTACIDALQSYESTERSLDDLRQQLSQRNKKVRDNEIKSGRKIEKLEAQVQNAEKLTIKVNELKNRLTKSDTLLNQKNHELEVSDKQVGKLKNQIKEATHLATKNITAFENARQENIKNAAEFQRTLIEEKARTDALANDLARKIEVLTNQISNLETNSSLRARELEIQLTLAKNALSDAGPYISELEELIHRFSAGTSNLLTSKRWKFGNTLFSLRHQILFKKPPPSSADYLGWLDQDYRKIKKLSAASYLHVFDSLEEVTRVSISAQHPQSKSVNQQPVESRQIDIVVCVHNALDDVQRCLKSIVHCTAGQYNLFLIDDGSDKETEVYLYSFSNKSDQVSLTRNETAQGYTRSANIGLKQSVSDLVILLNSDTIVTPMWDQKLLACANSDPSIGIVGPLSNAASWQSVPYRRSPTGDWKVNEIPAGHDVNSLAKLVSDISKKQYPAVALVNGFCFGIKRKVIETIGFLDEEKFPRGYGEENDYCLRAADNGFTLALADDSYVYHAKSKSFTHDGRKKLSKQGGLALKERYGQERIQTAVNTLKDSKVLRRIRASLAFSTTFREMDLTEELINSKLKVLFLLPVSGGGGGVHSIVQETLGLRRLGVYTRVAIFEKHRAKFQQHYPDYWKSVFCFLEDKNAMEKYASNFDVVVATIFTSVKILNNVYKSGAAIQPAYYIQDYEPWFCEKGSGLRNEALNSYTLIPDMHCFAKTKWLCELIKEKHNIQVAKVTPSIDKDVFYVDTESCSSHKKIVISAMIRPSTPRRAPELTMRVLRAIKEHFNDEVEIIIFGCDDGHPFYKNKEWSFEYTNYGHIIRSKVAEILRTSDVFLDLSTYQAFGRTGLEAMACGCVPVLPEKGGVHEYAVHEKNSLIVETSNKSLADIVNSTTKLVSDPVSLAQYRDAALDTAKKYDISQAAKSLSAFFLSITKTKND